MTVNIYECILRIKLFDEIKGIDLFFCLHVFDGFLDRFLDRLQGAIALTIGSVLRGTIPNHVIFIDHYRGQLI